MQYLIIHSAFCEAFISTGETGQCKTPRANCKPADVDGRIPSPCATISRFPRCNDVEETGQCKTPCGNCNPPRQKRLHCCTTNASVKFCLLNPIPAHVSYHHPVRPPTTPSFAHACLLLSGFAVERVGGSTSSSTGCVRSLFVRNLIG